MRVTNGVETESGSLEHPVINAHCPACYPEQAAEERQKGVVLDRVATTDSKKSKDDGKRSRKSSIKVEVFSVNNM